MINKIKQHIKHYDIFYIFFGCIFFLPPIFITYVFILLTYTQWLKD